MELASIAIIYVQLGAKKKNSWMRDPRYKHEDLDNGQDWATITTDDESDKHLEAQDSRSSCLMFTLQQ